MKTDIAIPSIPLDAPFRVQIPPRVVEVFDPLDNLTKKIEVGELLVRIVDQSTLNSNAINTMEIFPGVYIGVGALP